MERGKRGEGRGVKGKEESNSEVQEIKEGKDRESVRDLCTDV